MIVRVGNKVEVVITQDATGMIYTDEYKVVNGKMVLVEGMKAWAPEELEEVCR